MNALQAKRIPLRDWLAWLGFEPHHQVKGELWYLSPFRQEQTPSFKVAASGQAWYDHGEGEGGTIIEFMLKYRQLATVQDALDALSQLSGTSLPTGQARRSPASRARAEDDIEITARQPLSNRALVQYLARRGLSVELARHYVQEVHYIRNQKPYFSLGFANDSGGLELRNAYYKGSTGPKDITTIRRSSAKGAPEASPALAVFEGFMDFLSALKVAAIPPEVQLVIVMNSAALLQRTLKAIQASATGLVYLYLDNDEKGSELTQQLTTALSGIEVQDQRPLYASYKDFNAMLEAQASDYAAT